MTGSGPSKKILRALFIILAMAALAMPGTAASDEPGGGTQFDSSWLQEIVLDHIEENMPWQPGSVRVEFLGRIQDMTIAGDNIDYRVEARRNENYIGQTSFRARFYDGGVVVADQSFRVRIEVLKEFVVSSRSLEDGRILAENDLAVVQRWVDRPPRGRIDDAGQVVGMMIRGSIAQNTELQERMLRQPQLVRRGDLVRVVLSRGSLRMETVAVSAEAGALGDRIRVRNTASNNLFYARVVDEAVVHVDF